MQKICPRYRNRRSFEAFDLSKINQKEYANYDTLSFMISSQNVGKSTQTKQKYSRVQYRNKAFVSGKKNVY